MFTVTFQQSSPYRDENCRYSPRGGSPLPPMLSPSSPDFASAMNHHALNRSCDSNASSSSFDPAQSPLPSITVSNTSDVQDSNNNSKNDHILNDQPKGLAEQFNLDDLSASFRSLYKSVFQSSLSGGAMNGNGSQITASKDVMLNGRNLFVSCKIRLSIEDL